MQSEFLQIESAPEAQEKTVFIIPDGLFEFKMQRPCNLPAGNGYGHKVGYLPKLPRRYGGVF